MPEDPRFFTFADRASQLFDLIESRGQRGIESGFFEIDDMLNGMQCGELIVIGSRPSVGKTSIACNMAEHVAADSLLPVGFISLELSLHQLTQRMLCSRGQIDQHKLRKGMLQAHEYAHLANIVGELAKIPLFVTSRPRMHIEEVCELGRELKQNHGIRLLTLDYVQRLDGPGGNRAEELANISRSLKGLAMELEIPLLCTSELNRGMFQPDLPRPRMADLRGSGTLEEDADVVMLLHREDLNHQEEPDFVPDNIAEVVVAKQRNGPTGSVKLTFNSKSLRFENLSTISDPF